MAPFVDQNVQAVKLLEQPWTGEKVLQVRTGKIKPVFGKELSAIFKHSRSGAITVTSLGLDGDEHAFEFHGGPEKALMQYSLAHYTRWRNELPQSHDLFVKGAFGENIVARHANERNICIGDIIQIGNVVAQVCDPRQPCFKLNLRFQVKDMAKRAQDLFRTGWFYRIIKPGTIQAGDGMKLVERLNPDCPVSKVQYYLYHDVKNEQAMRSLVEVQGLGSESRNIFLNRLKKQYEDQSLRLNGMAMDIWSNYALVSKNKETPRIVSLEFEAQEPREKPNLVLPGSHVRLRLGGKLVRAYSVVSGDSNHFTLAVALSESSRGGSHYIHSQLEIGNTLEVGKMAASFPLSGVAECDKHIFIAGGIGLTAFIAAAQSCQRSNFPYHLHYLVRNTADIALKDYLQEFGKNITIYDKSVGKTFDITSVLNQVDDRSHVYCCGSRRLQQAVGETALSMGIARSRLHFEQFEISTSGDPFTAELSDSGKQIEVDGNQTLLDALRNAGLDIPSSCEAGNCGTCRVGVKGGKVEHRGTGLLDDEKCSAMLSCVSRGIGTIVLDL